MSKITSIEDINKLISNKRTANVEVEFGGQPVTIVIQELSGAQKQEALSECLEPGKDGNYRFSAKRRTHGDALAIANMIIDVIIDGKSQGKPESWTPDVIHNQFPDKVYLKINDACTELNNGEEDEGKETASS